ncbi:V-type ATP synthase subunit K [Aerococcaceae bacterium WGS1372]
MEFLQTLFGENIGLIFGGLGVAIATFGGGVGSARAVGIAGESAAALVKEKPELFVQSLVLQLLPATQGLYGFVIGLLMLLNLNTSMDTSTGWYYLMCALPVAITGYTSAPAQARATVAGMQILAKRPENVTQGIIFSAMVETYAILGFVISLLMFLFV